MSLLREGAKGGEFPSFFGGGQSMLIKTGGVSMNFSHNGGDNIVSLCLGGNTFFLSNFVSGGGHYVEIFLPVSRLKIMRF